jgi:glycogen phosphorylase
MTQLALNLSGFVNGVARRHGETARRRYPGYRIRDITNGVHAPTWTHPAFARLYAGIAPGWRHAPEELANADQLDDAAVWDAHHAAKAELLALIERRCGVRLQADRPLIEYARRMTGYKRPDMIFADLERLLQINRRTSFQLVVSGKAHSRDDGGKAMIETIHRAMRDIGEEIPCAFLPGYDMALAQVLVAGADVWLNTPLPPLEASGTSGMKAGLNGGLNLSVLDGWWMEACIEGLTGWGIGGGEPDHAAALHAKLEHVVLPLYHHDGARWVWMIGGDQQDRQPFQQPPHDPEIRLRGLSEVTPGLARIAPEVASRVTLPSTISRRREWP